MTILAVMESEESIAELTRIIASVQPDADLVCFGSSLPALAAARGRPIDVAFLDVMLSELGGFGFGQYLRELNPSVNLIYLSDTDRHAFEALRQHASGYLMKPITEELVKRELEDLRYPTRAGKRVFARTFGSFELFVDDEPMRFKYSRTKEIVALLVHNRGGQTTNGEIIAALWEDDGDPEKKASYLSNLRQDLQNTLSGMKLGGLLRKQRGSLAIAADRIECDLYDWLAHGETSRYRYFGEYMSQYSWAETMHTELDEIDWALREGRESPVP